MTTIKDIFFQNTNADITLSTFSNNYSANDFKLSMENYLNLLQHEDLTGKRIGLLIPDIFSYLSLVLTINELGGTIVPLSAAFRKEDLTAVLETIDPHYVITVEEVDGFSFIDIFASWSEKRGRKTKIFSTANYSNWDTLNFDGEKRPLQEEKLDFILCTSGSTGVPKGIVMSVDTLPFSLEIVREVNNIQKGDRIFLNTPPSSVFGICNLLSCINNGAHIVYPDNFDLSGIVQLMSACKINKVISTPSVFNAIYQAAKVLNPQVLLNLENVVFCGEMMTDNILDSYTIMKDCEFVGLYGSSELGGGMYCNLRDKIEFTVFEGIEYKVVESEILFKSPAAFSQYYQNPELTKDAFDTEGWYLSGDLVKETESNKIKIIGRKKDMIKKAGQQVIPGEVEQVLMKNDQVKQAVVFGVPHKVFGEQVVAYVVGEMVDIHELFGSCKKQIANYKVPDYIDVIQEIPLIQGKVDKLTLKKLFIQKQETGISDGEK